MALREFLRTIVENRKFIALKRASFHKYADLEQLFRAMLALFELWLVLDHVRLHEGRPLLIASLSVYLGLNLTVMLLQNFWRGLRSFNGLAACMVDTVFFSAFLALGGDFSHVFILNFLFVPFCLGLKLGSRVGSPFILINLFAFIGVDLYRIFAYREADTGSTAAWTAFIGGLGYFLARWGSAIRRDIHKQGLLRRIREYVQPGVGIHVACDYILTELRAFLGVESCSVLLYLGNREQTARTVMLADGKPLVEVDHVPKWKLEMLRTLDDDCSYMYTRRDGSLDSFVEFRDKEWVEVEPPEWHERLGEDDPDLTFLTVPLRGPHEVYGRFYVRGTATRRLTFDDMSFVWRLVDMVAIYLENLRLSEKIAEDAAEIERQRIALDIHDSVVQPYIAVQLGISGLRRKIAADSAVVAEDVDRLDSLVQLGISDLRDYVRGLRDGSGDGPKRTLFASVDRYAVKFGEATGISVVFRHDEFRKDDISGRLSADLFQMICEGVSNARKHTRSRRILVELTKTDTDIHLSIEDEGENKDFFLPRSISQRAALHGGTVKVIPAAAGGVRIRVEIPTKRKL